MFNVHVVYRRSDFANELCHKIMDFQGFNPMQLKYM